MDDSASRARQENRWVLSSCTHPRQGRRCQRLRQQNGRPVNETHRYSRPRMRLRYNAEIRDTESGSAIYRNPPLSTEQSTRNGFTASAIAKPHTDIAGGEPWTTVIDSDLFERNIRRRERIAAPASIAALTVSRRWQTKRRINKRSAAAPSVVLLWAGAALDERRAGKQQKITDACECNKAETVGACQRVSTLILQQRRFENAPLKSHTFVNATKNWCIYHRMHSRSTFRDMGVSCTSQKRLGEIWEHSQT